MPQPPASAGARNWYPAAYDAERKNYYASVLDMGNLMFTVPPGTPAEARRPKALNVQTTLIFTPQLQAVLPTLPPAIREQVEKLPEMQWVKDKPYSSELRAIALQAGMRPLIAHGLDYARSGKASLLEVYRASI